MSLRLYGVAYGFLVNIYI